MSERQIRGYATHKPSCKLFVDWKTCTCGYGEARSQPPDLVALLQFVSGLWRDSWGRFERQAALEEVIDYINKTVRLTDDGWEWVHED